MQAQERIEGFIDERLWEERWREGYVNWIAKDDITLSQATSPHLQRPLCFLKSAAVAHRMSSMLHLVGDIFRAADFGFEPLVSAGGGDT